MSTGCNTGPPGGGFSKRSLASTSNRSHIGPGLDSRNPLPSGIETQTGDLPVGRLRMLRSSKGDRVQRPRGGYGGCAVPPFFKKKVENDLCSIRRGGNRFTVKHTCSIVVRIRGR